MKNMHLVLLLIAFCMPLVSEAALRIDDEDLLLYVPFNGSVEDLSPYALECELVGNGDFVDGKHDEALKFAENIEVKAPYIPLNERSFTVCMWVMPELSGNSEQCVFSQMDNNATNTSLHFRIYTSGQIRMGFYNNDLDAPGAVKKGEWAHIAFWLDVEGKSRRIYVNGEQVAEDAGKSGIAYLGTKGNTMIGSWSTSGQKFNGVIDEVQVWNRPLTEEEIKQSMDDLLSSFAVDADGKLVTTWSAIKSGF